MALRRFDRDDAPFADLGFERQKGRHRSLFIGDLTAQYLELCGFPVELRLHHCRPLGALGERGDCGCGAGLCTNQPRPQQSPECRWQREQRQARDDCFAL
eukprot:467433-Alexandrium_andersonii.AAC.1